MPLSALSTNRHDESGTWKVTARHVGESSYYEMLEYWLRHRVFLFCSLFPFITKFLNTRAHGDSVVVKDVVGEVYCCVHMKELFRMLKKRSRRLAAEAAKTRRHHSYFVGLLIFGFTLISGVTGFRKRP